MFQRLRSGDGARLRALTRSSAAAAGLVQRARMVLLAAEGLSNTEIGQRVGMTRQTAISWRARYQAGGTDALADLPRSGRPPEVDEAAVVVATLNPPPARLGVTHWSARLMSDHLFPGRLFSRDGRPGRAPGRTETVPSAVLSTAS